MAILSLMYHDVVRNGEYNTSGFTDIGAKKYKVDHGKFLEQIKSISRLVADPTEDISRIERLGRRRNRTDVFLTFDDGGLSAYEYAVGTLERYGLKGYFFVTAKYIDTPGFLSKKQIIDMKKRGHMIGSHSFSHPLRLSKLSYSAILEEWKKSMNILNGILGEEISAASVPGGYCSPKVVKAAREAGIRVLFTSEKVMRVRLENGMAVLGRYTVYGSMPVKAVYKLASGDIIQRSRQWVCSKYKNLLKAAGGRGYLKFREMVFKIIDWSENIWL